MCTIDGMIVQNTDLSWVAGLIIGEGCWTHTSARGAGGWRYLCFQLSMYDGRAVKKMARILKHHGLVAKVAKHPPHEKKQGICYHKIHLAGKKAEQLAELVFPMIRDTDKGDQLIEVLEQRCGQKMERGVIQRPERPKTSSGERNGNSKLTRRNVTDIRRAMKNRVRGDGMAGKLAEKYGVSKATVYHIARNLTWH